MDSGNLIRPDRNAEKLELQTHDIGRQYRLDPDFQFQSQNSIREYWSILLKRKMVVIAPAIILVTLAAIASMRATPIYDALGRVSIHREGSGLAAFKEGSVDMTQEDYDPTIALETQTRVLESDSLALQVVKRLHLDKNVKFAGPAANDKEKKTLQGPAQFSPNEETSLIDGFKGSLAVKNIPNTRLLEIHFKNQDPRLAAEIVNTLIAEYIEQNIKTKYDATMQASEWLTNQLADLQIKVESSQKKLVQYQQENGILGGDEKQNIIVAKLEDLNKQLTDAETDRIRKDSLYRQTLSANPENAIPAPQNATLLKLHDQELEVQKQYSQATLQFGPSYPKVVELENQLKQIQAATQAEVKKASRDIQGEYMTAVGREKMLRKAFEEQKQQANLLNQRAIQYSLLKRDADSNRQLYEGLLQRLKEAGMSAGLKSSNIQIVDPARVPTVPFSPNIPRNIELALMLGLGCGVAVAFVLEALDQTVHTAEQAEMISSLPSLGMVPLFRDRSLTNKYFTLAAKNDSASREVVALTHPKSEAAEAYRALRTSILLAGGTTPQVLLITSPLPQEGKTTTCVNCGIMLAQQGRRVLLVDGDLRRPSVHLRLKIQNKRGLTSILTGAATAADCIVDYPNVPNLSVLTAGPSPPRPAELLGSEKISILLEQWRKEYDHILIDTPPALSVTDAVLLSPKTDRVVLVIRAGQTTKGALSRARDLLMQVNAQVLGIVVNAVDLNAPQYYYYSYGSSHRGYYSDDTRANTKST